MPYNTDLENRIDHQVSRPERFVKKKMFGGVGYLIDGNMVFGIHKQSLIIRTSVEEARELLKRPSMSVFDITGRPMKGWVMVSTDGVKTDKELADLLNLALDFAKTLPPK